MALLLPARSSSKRAGNAAHAVLRPHPAAAPCSRSGVTVVYSVTFPGTALLRSIITPILNP